MSARANGGYHFTGWFKDNAKVSDSADYSFPVTANVTLTATFEKDPAPQKELNIFQRFIQWIKDFFAKLFGRR